ncbi:hypothetical protein PHLCEN_2v3797 [Hermanssonia centrifuga]|uniref:Uncharacterized protein n=1 Tax=Hermanssonia centrifuga TaxID=98765 RepID=A0A2R6QBM0_9APHY|nr:hypothetical protein PHLCEN_2v3797 [Hermanssonia centrifuga]
MTPTTMIATPSSTQGGRTEILEESQSQGYDGGSGQQYLAIGRYGLLIRTVLKEGYGTRMGDSMNQTRDGITGTFMSYPCTLKGKVMPSLERFRSRNVLATIFIESKRKDRI